WTRSMAIDAIAAAGRIGNRPMARGTRNGLLIGDLRAVLLRLDLDQICGRLPLRRCSFRKLGSLRLVVKLRKHGTSLDEVSLIGLDSNDLAGDLESHPGNNLCLDRANAEDPNLNI